MHEERKVVVPSPENSETPLGSVQSWVTPNRLFFVRNHFDIPEIDAQAWSLQIDGCVENKFLLNYEQLQAMPQRSVFSTMECAGNGRSFISPKAAGVQWGAGAVGHAEWSGVSLKPILEQAGLKPDVTEIVCTGADIGTEHDHPEQMNFARSIPLEKAMHPDTLLAMRMNGERLEASHGFPVRLLAPGWYGVASVKWLTQIEAINKPFDGYFQQVKYTVKRSTGHGVQSESVGKMPVKSEVIRPRDMEQIGIGTTRIFGLGWAGEDAVDAVEVSTNGGESWHRAELIGPRAPYSWNLWEYLWEVIAEGDYTLLSRTISEKGQVQPTKHDPLNAGYLINYSRPSRVQVDASQRTAALLGDTRTLEQEMSQLAEERAQLRLDVEMDLRYGAGI